MTVHKHAAFVAHSTEPFNGGTPLTVLRQHPVTPTEAFFVRNHGPIPAIDPQEYRLEVDGLVRTPLRLSLDELHSSFERVSAIATLQCAGNRRVELQAIAPIPNEILWDHEGVGTAAWAGVRLSDLLERAGVLPAAHHAAFLGLDQAQTRDGVTPFGGSIPLDRALAGDVLLAYEMNGAPLPPTHGFPLRVVVPGYIGARSVKWLGRVTLQERPSDNYFQARAYRLVYPGEDGPGQELGPLRVNAVIWQPNGGDVLPAGLVEVRGYALAGAGQTVERVEVSSDGGTTWRGAEWLEPARDGVWRHWQAHLELGPGSHELVARAWDAAGSTQPDDLRDTWNAKGYMNNALHRVRVSVERRAG